MAEPIQIDGDSVVGDVMGRWPATIGTFLALKMGCVGCPIAPFHTVKQACREHAVDQDAFLAAARAAAPNRT